MCRTAFLARPHYDFFCSCYCIYNQKRPAYRGTANGSRRKPSEDCMNRPIILVTGATGKTGGAVVSQLLPLGWPVRALVRAPDARSERLRAQGAEIAVADLFDPEQLLEAMRGTARAY